MENIEIKGTDIKLHNILFATTSVIDYEMERLILLEDMESANDQYVLVEGSHCSCYNFDETYWDAISLTYEELTKLMQSLSESDYFDGMRKKLREFLEYYWRVDLHGAHNRVKED